MDQKPKQYMRQTQRAQYKDMAVQPCTLEVNYAGSTTLHEGTPVIVEAQTRKRKQVWDVKGFGKSDLKKNRVKEAKEKVVVLAGNIFPGRNETQHVAVHTSGIVDVVVDPDMIKPATGRFIHKPALSSFGFNTASSNIPFGTHVDATRVMLGDGGDPDQLDDETLLAIVTSIEEYIQRTESEVLLLISEAKTNKSTMAEEEFNKWYAENTVTIQSFFGIAKTGEGYSDAIKGRDLKEKARLQFELMVPPLKNVEQACKELDTLRFTSSSGSLGGPSGVGFGGSPFSGLFAPSGSSGARFSAPVRRTSSPRKPTTAPTAGGTPTKEDSPLKKYKKSSIEFKREFKDANNTDALEMENNLNYFILESGSSGTPGNEIEDKGEKKDFVKFISDIRNATDTSGQFWLALQTELLKSGGMPETYAKRPDQYVTDRLRLWKSGLKIGVLLKNVSLLL
jgi:hypothetical protein